MADPIAEQPPPSEANEEEEIEDERLADVAVGGKESKLTNQRLDLSSQCDTPTNPLLKSPSVRGPMIKHKSAQPRSQQREVNRRDQKKGLNPRRPLYTGTLAQSSEDITILPPTPRLTERSKFTMEEIQEILGVLQEVSNGRLEITQKKFEEVLRRLEQKGFSSLKNMSLQSRMFELFDADGNRSLDARELIAGLSLICKGTPEERLKLTFDLYDADGSGTLNRAELFQGLKSAHEHAVALSKDKEGAKTESRRNAMSKIKDCVDDIMRAFDVDGNSTIDFEEFKSWGMRSPFLHLGSEDDGYLTMGEMKGKSVLQGLKTLNVRVISGDTFNDNKEGKFRCTFLCSKVLGAEGHVMSAEERKELKGKVQTPCFAGVEVGTLPTLSIAIDEEESDGLFIEILSVGVDDEESHVGDTFVHWSFVEGNLGKIREVPVNATHPGQAPW
eukprot:CAMPEP_0201532900 /NCGR_PEP_ID=MMETSP0161_2-20130828/51541_1 /ASSEMBLY_ACC=CAM_ASM_000251 /TAXON_ID=180227 /ORGANISM="Neoparamoeba aestuarina, Strain SoJaBio B1-5/56/2" /LENGTH=443 /DNA_ID=CAMNT_0047936559 /DNA_START=67 /DNA_END=1395 /DNA_ORIENTATION=-